MDQTGMAKSRGDRQQNKEIVIYLRLIGSAHDFTGDAKKPSAPQPQSSESPHGERTGQDHRRSHTRRKQHKLDLFWGPTSVRSAFHTPHLLASIMAPR